MTTWILHQELIISSVECRRCGNRNVLIVDYDGYLCAGCSRGDSFQLELPL